MVKYSYELKRQVIQDYLDDLGGYKKLAQKYDLPTWSIILQWLNVYEHYGFEGLKRKRKKRTYSREFKLHAIEYYLSKDIFYREAANQLELDAHPFLQLGYSNITSMVRMLLKTMGSVKL